ncbi:MAG: aminopeptidase P family protein [Alcanivoracaceae bacterium]|nr:aminopeptidase P family protein [Alcanivoracaceae bacterium]
MTIGIGGSTAKKQLKRLKPVNDNIKTVALIEFKDRIKQAQTLMKQQAIDAIYLNAGSNLYYFTGTKWHPSERMVGAILPSIGDIEYMAPHFEIDTLKEYTQVEGKIHPWHEHENPYQLFGQIIKRMGIENGMIALDEATAFFITDGIQQCNPHLNYKNAKSITAYCRMHKSKNEIALMQRVKSITMTVQKSVARILYRGISTTEVTDFINKAHIKLGAQSGSYFCIVLFGTDSAYPHGVKNPQQLAENDMVLIDTGCQIDGYISDITRSYVFGEPNERHRQVWDTEKASQAAAFAAAQLGNTCANVDQAARSYLTKQGFGPEYNTPGLPHRTGHGIGLDIHEWPYLVAGDDTQLNVGMCFSNEPMLCVPGEFGVRLEDHFYMTENGPKWFTQPAYSIDDPFGYEFAGTGIQ